ncbi:DUF6409 family protein [Streptomyces mexicanus]|jgi:hypothetical protein|uniref:DUF6409 family protein n=1 Tax=Streptomyces mexicanus TaxID=178566 RepID=UPI0031E97A76
MTTTPEASVSVRDFPVATLVLAGPWERGHRLDSRPGIVVGPFGGPHLTGQATMVVVWFFADGAPEPGPTLQAMYPHELTPIDDTLTTMHQDAFRHIVRNLRQGRFAYDDGQELRAAVLRAWLQRTGLTAADPAERHAAHHI